jgi:hypothetical protein
MSNTNDAPSYPTIRKDCRDAYLRWASMRDSKTINSDERDAWRKYQDACAAYRIMTRGVEFMPVIWAVQA